MAKYFNVGDRIEWDHRSWPKADGPKRNIQAPTMYYHAPDIRSGVVWSSAGASGARRWVLPDERREGELFVLVSVYVYPANRRIGSDEDSVRVEYLETCNGKSCTVYNADHQCGQPQRWCDGCGARYARGRGHDLDTMRYRHDCPAERRDTGALFSRTSVDKMPPAR